MASLSAAAVLYLFKFQGLWVIDSHWLKYKDIKVKGTEKAYDLQNYSVKTMKQWYKVTRRKFGSLLPVFPVCFTKMEKLHFVWFCSEDTGLLALG